MVETKTRLHCSRLMLTWQVVCLCSAVLCGLVSAGCQGFAGADKTRPQKSFFSKFKSAKKKSKDPEDALDPLGARNADRIVLQDLSPTQIGSTLKSKFTRRNEPEVAQRLYDEAQELYQQGLQSREQNPDGASHEKSFEQAAKKFRLAGLKMPDSSLEQDALFFEGESLFFANRYVQANRAYEKLVANYSGTRYLDMAESRRFAIAQYWLGLAREQDSFLAGLPRVTRSRPVAGLAGEARRVLNRIRIDDPTGKLADDATMALANAFFEARLYQDAAETYEDLRRSYPGTPHLFQAHIFELKARMNSYYGESYDDEPLVKADQLLRQIVLQFRDQLGEEEEYLAKEGAAIRNMLANRDYALGSYYEKRGENRAASMMYAQVAKDHPQSELGKLAQERVAALDGKQPLPTQHAEWLVEMFPQSDRGRPMIAGKGNDSLIR
ncbi:MAG: tetratricopeptide repeat protein [Pirellulaceae bacterium]